jgi:hypothetical protein
MDKRKNNKGQIGNAGGGRKSKIDELAFLEKLDNIIDSDSALLKLKNLIENDNFPALKLYLNYRFGAPKETIEQVNTNTNFSIKELFSFEADKQNHEIKIISDALDLKYS